jgi:hypothetical protein
MYKSVFVIERWCGDVKDGAILAYETHERAKSWVEEIATMPRCTDEANWSYTVVEIQVLK